jgi:PPOX class probable F420-dependent enzyme
VPSRRAEIAFTDDEARAFLEEQRTVFVATLGPRGWPHVVPLWYVVRDGEVWVWTYARSQKVRNLERDARATLSVEAGDEYAELRGVMIEARAELHRDLDTVVGFARELFARHGGGDEDVLRKQAPKRVAIRFVEERRASWDHRKLGGGY